MFRDGAGTSTTRRPGRLRARAGADRLSAAGSACAAAPDLQAHRLAHSAATFTRAQLADLMHAPDWYPSEHPTMPTLVADGAARVYACGFCHLPNGFGRPENASLAGLPAAYIVKQVQDIAHGVRASAIANRAPTTFMQTLSRTAANDPGLAEAAGYFAAITYTPMTRIVETAEIPAVDVAGWIYRKRPGREALGARIVEVADDVEQFELRDPHATYTAYVPIGSIAKGEPLAQSCLACHGPGLRGSPIAPPIAGRSPTYIARQLIDMRSGTRHGEGAKLMAPIVTALTNDDVIALAAFAGSRVP